MDVLLDGGSFRYLAAFWERVGALVRREDGAGWVDGVNSPEEEAEVVLRLAAEWVSAGAPVEWARKEAGSALRALRASGRAMPWGVT